MYLIDWESSMIGLMDREPWMMGLMDWEFWMMVLFDFSEEGRFFTGFFGGSVLV